MNTMSNEARRRVQLRQLTARAERKGIIPRPGPCARCGLQQTEPRRGVRRAVEWHHPQSSYQEGHHTEGLIPLCPPCHRGIHLSSWPEPGTGHMWGYPGLTYSALVEIRSARNLSRGGLTKILLAGGHEIDLRTLRAWESRQNAVPTWAIDAYASVLNLSDAEVRGLVAWASSPATSKEGGE